LIYNSLILNFSILKDNEGYTVFRVIFAEVYVPLSDFLTVMTLLYLFYFQAIRQISQQEKVFGRQNQFQKQDFI